MFRDLIPPKARQYVYLGFAAAVVVATALELPDVVEIVVGLGALFGFSLAAGNINDPDDVG